MTETSSNAQDLTVRLTPKLIDRIRNAASERDITEDTLVEELLKEAFDELDRRAELARYSDDGSF